MSVEFESAEPATPSAAGAPKRAALMAHLAAMGPGLAVMLADTDAGSLITAAQSGAQWGYTLLSAQIILIPIVDMVRELTTRLGVVTGKGHGELIEAHFGRGWGVAVSGHPARRLHRRHHLRDERHRRRRPHVGHSHVGLPGAMMAFLLTVVVTGSYLRVERVALAVGLFELVFQVAMVMSSPQPGQMKEGLASCPVGNSDYLFLVAANIGAVVMPWMIFYPQSAVVDKGLGIAHIKGSRWDTAVGSVATQLVMIAMLVTTAATLWANNEGGVDLNTVEQISDAITPDLGVDAGRILFSLGIVGALLVAAIVVSLTAARAWARSLATAAASATA